jgi:hypothetical protein
MKLALVGTGCVLLAGIGLADADELSEEEAAVQIHGFASQGALYTTDNNFLANTERGSLEFTEAGINLTKALDDRLRVGFQLFTRDLGPEGNYSAKFDWFGLDYRWRDWLGIRAGRTKLPFGLYNDVSDIDAAHSVVLLPQSVYPATNRNLLLAQTGVELYGYKRFESAGALDYRAYFGKIHVDVPTVPGLEIDTFELVYVAGGRVLWETPIEGLRLGPTMLRTRLDAKYSAGGVEISQSVGLTQVLGSVEYQNGSLSFAAEYGRGYQRPLGPGARQPRTVNEAGYAMAAYRWRPWLQTTAYYSLAYPNVEDRVGRDSRQHDAAATVRFDLTSHWILKLEGHALRGTSALSPALNDDIAPAGLANKWYLLAAKTTVYF